MRNKSDFGWWCVTVFVLCMELAACVPVPIAEDIPTAIVTYTATVIPTATDTPVVVVTPSATIIPTVFSCAQVTDIPPAECAALVALYKSTDGANWESNRGWLKTATPCSSWVGVQCLDDHVTGLLLRSQRLSGTVPPEIADLANLHGLDLSGNQLTALPPEIGGLSNLTDLGLGGNQLTVLPHEIGDLSNLGLLDLGYNQLTALPPEIGKLSRLTALAIEDNQLTVIPPEIGKLSNLYALSLAGNSLTTLPPEFGNLSNLTHLYLEDNPFTGTVPPSIINLDKLASLSLSPCSGLTSSDPQVIAFLDARSPGWNQCR